MHNLNIIQIINFKLHWNISFLNVIQINSFVWYSKNYFIMYGILTSMELLVNKRFTISIFSLSTAKYNGVLKKKNNIISFEKDVC